MEKEDKHDYGVGFLVHKDVSSTVITVRLRAVPFNITVVKAYAPTSDYNDNEIEEVYNQL